METLNNGASYATQRAKINNNFASAQTQIDYITSNGIQPWVATIIYPTAGLTVGDDGFVYKALVLTTGDIPSSSPTKWVLWGGVGATYTITNPPVDIRTFDPATATLNELGNIVATLLKDLSN